MLVFFFVEKYLIEKKSNIFGRKKNPLVFQKKYFQNRNFDFSKISKIEIFGFSKNLNFSIFQNFKISKISICQFFHFFFEMVLLLYLSKLFLVTHQSCKDADDGTMDKVSREHHWIPPSTPTKRADCRGAGPGVASKATRWFNGCILKVD